MKKKKKQEKKTFGRFFRRRFCICLLATAFLVGWLFFYEGWKKCTHVEPESFITETDMLEHEDPDDTETKLEKNLKAVDEGKNQLFKTISDRLTASSQNGFKSDMSERALMLYQPETGEIYTSQSFATASVWQNEEKQIYYLRDQDLVNRIEKSDNFYDGYYDFSYNIYSIYVKDDQFLPGEVYVCKDIISLLEYHYYLQDGEKIPGEWVDMSPEDTEGWTKICGTRSREYLETYHSDHENHYDQAKELSKDGNPYIGSVYVFGSANSPRADYLMQRMQEELPAMQKELMQHQKESIHEFIYGELGIDAETGETPNREELVLSAKKSYKSDLYNLPMKIYRQSAAIHPIGQKLTILNGYMVGFNGRKDAPYNYEAGMDDVQFRGQKWVLFHFQYVKPFQYFRLMYLQYAPILILPCLFLVTVCALLWSVIAYLLYSRRYDIEAYRRNLTGALAHDLKTPLAVIYGNAENIRTHAHPENTDEYADFIMENVTHMDEMIAGVLNLAQLESKAKPEMKEQVDLTALLHTAFQRNAPQMDARGLTLSESGRLILKGNAEMLAQLAENLAANAVQHTAEGGTITVTAEKRSVRISNPYTGELDEKELCEPFRRGDAARGSQSGSGLGLSIVQQIAALHRYRLLVTAREGIFTAELRADRISGLKAMLQKRR